MDIVDKEAGNEQAQREAIMFLRIHFKIPQWPSHPNAVKSFALKARFSQLQSSVTEKLRLHVTIGWENFLKRH